MAKHRAKRRNLPCAGVTCSAGATLVSAAVVGIGVTQATHPLTALVRLMAGPSDTGPDAFTLGPYTFDPYTTPVLIPEEGWATFPAPVFPGPPLFNISGGNLDGLGLATKDFEVFNSSGQEVGTIGTAGTILQVLGEDSYEFTVTSSTPLLGDTAADLPAVGTVYDIFNGFAAGIDGEFGFDNAYEATPSGTVADYVVLPSGQYSLADPIPQHPVCDMVEHCFLTGPVQSSNVGGADLAVLFPTL